MAVQLNPLKPIRRFDVFAECIVTRTDQPVDGPGRPVAVGNWDQIRADAQKLADAGVDEAFFDVSFQPDVDDLKSYLGYMDRFRAILEAPVAV